jgi:hypothetical protein
VPANQFGRGSIKTLCGNTLHQQDGRLEMRPPPDSKSPRPVSRRGLNSCDDEQMPVICPTEQDVSQLA